MTSIEKQLGQHQAQIVDLERQTALLQRIVAEQSAIITAMREALAAKVRR